MAFFTLKCLPVYYSNELNALSQNCQYCSQSCLVPREVSTSSKLVFNIYEMSEFSINWAVVEEVVDGEGKIGTKPGTSPFGVPLAHLSSKHKTVERK